MAPRPENQDEFDGRPDTGARPEINVTPGRVPPLPSAPPAPPAPARPWFARAPLLTPPRIVAVFAIAVLTDALQIALGPLGWVGIVQVLDIIAMVATTVLIGFHVLLLPTFILEAIPLVDAVPTWVACVAIVVALRRRQQTRSDAGR